jgi:hypothetical protein
MALYEIASETARRILINALLAESKNDQKCLSADRGLQRLDIPTIWVLQLFGGPHTSFL